MLPCRQKSSGGSCVPGHWRHDLKVTAPQPLGTTPPEEDLLPTELKSTPLPQSKHLGPQTQGSPHPGVPLQGLRPYVSDPQVNPILLGLQLQHSPPFPT